jgi:hypothetical protein
MYALLSNETWPSYRSLLLLHKYDNAWSLFDSSRQSSIAFQSIDNGESSSWEHELTLQPTTQPSHASDPPCSQHTLVADTGLFRFNRCQLQRLKLNAAWQGT